MYLKKMWKAGYVYMLSVFILNCLAMEDSKLKVIEVGDGYRLVPYAKHHRRDLETVVNDPEVYPNIRHGGVWDEELLNKRHADYIAKNAAFTEGKVYAPENFAVCWVLEAPDGKVIGRGGLQDSDEYEPVMTEVFFAIIRSHQWKLGANNNLGLGKKAFQQIVHWFHDNVGENVPLRWLSMRSNERSKHLALTLGFKPVMKEDGDQVEVDGWGNPYLVFQLDQAHLAP